MSWQAIRSAAALEVVVGRRRRVVERDLDDVDAVAGAVGRRAVDDQAVVLRVRHAGRGVRAARQVDERLDVGLRRVADVEDVQALLPGLHDAVSPHGQPPAGMPFEDAESHERVMTSP